MDAPTFDRLVVALTSVASRRRIAKALFGGGLMSAATLLASGHAVAKCVAEDNRCGTNFGDCCSGLKCCRVKPGVKRCRDLLTNRRACGTCRNPCPKDQTCVHGTCSCDPSNNTCPNEVDGQCTCGASVPEGDATFQAACVGRNSACNLDEPCDTNNDCAPRSVCLLGCQDPPDPTGHGGRRCSKPCFPV